MSDMPPPGEEIGREDGDEPVHPGAISGNIEGQVLGGIRLREMLECASKITGIFMKTCKRGVEQAALAVVELR